MPKTTPTADAAWRAVTTTDPASLDREAIVDFLGSVNSVRAACDAAEVLAIRRTRELNAAGAAEPAENLLANKTARSSKNARQASTREKACAAMPTLEEGLADGTMSAGHLDAAAAAHAKLDDDVAQQFAAHADQLLARSRQLGVDEFERECRDLARHLTALNDPNAEVDELERQKAASSVKRWVDKITGMHNTLISLDPLRDAKMWKVINNQVGRERQRRTEDGEPSLPFPALQAQAVVNAITAVAPGAPAEPGTPGAPATPDAPGAPAEPATPSAPGTPSGPVTPDAPAPPADPGASDAPVTPGAPATRGTAATPGASERSQDPVDRRPPSRTGPAAAKTAPDAPADSGASAAADTTSTATPRNSTRPTATRTGTSPPTPTPTPAPTPSCGSSAAAFRLPEISILCDLETLTSGIRAAGGLCETDDGVAIPPATLRRLACDAKIIPILLATNGEVLDQGRRARTATPAQRNALAAMHRGCTFPGCTIGFSDSRIHHIRWWWEHRGPTDIDNLLPLCEGHHHLVHEGGWGLALDTGRIATWTRPDGSVHYRGPTIDRRSPGLPLRS